MKSNTRIIQASGEFTGSTLLINYLVGFFCPKSAATFGVDANIKDNLITKTHYLELDDFEKRFGSRYDLWFVSSCRKIDPARPKRVFRNLDDKYFSRKNVLTIDFNRLRDTDYVFDSFLNFFPSNLIPNQNHELIKQQMLSRIQAMNKRYSEISSLPRSYVDPIYGLHGSHRKS